jgi:hypothetical protein
MGCSDCIAKPPDGDGGPLVLPVDAESAFETEFGAE